MSIFLTPAQGTKKMMVFSLIMISGLLSPCAWAKENEQRGSRDTTIWMFSESQLNQVIREIKPKPSGGLSPAAVALLGALIGAISALSSQLLVIIFGSQKERRNLRRELIAEERSLSVLLVELYRELAWLKVNYEFWYRLSNIKKGDMPYQQFLLIRDRTSECKRNLNTALANYFKTVTRFTTLTEKNKSIQDQLKKVKEFSFQKLESDTFANIDDIGALNKKAEEEAEKLRNKYTGVSDLLDGVYDAMIAAIP